MHKTFSTWIFKHSIVLSQSYDNNNLVDAVYTDFQKAFDKVNRSTLSYKLVLFGYSGTFLSGSALL